MKTLTGVLTSPKRLIIVVGFAAVLLAHHAAYAGARPRIVATDQQPIARPVVNINTATEAEYAFLPGVGPKLASALNDYAEAKCDHGASCAAFATVDELLKAKGIKAAKLAKMRPYVVMTGKTTATTKIRGGAK